MAMKKPVKKNDPRSDQKVDQAYKALVAAKESKRRGSSPSAGTRTRRAEITFDSTSSGNKKMEKLFNSLTPAERTAISMMSKRRD